MRGVASLGVAIIHSGFDSTPWVSFWMFPDAAVDLFFCLSGFSLCLAYNAGGGQPLRFWRYFRARVARIYPLYAVCLALMYWLVFRHLAGSSYYPMWLARRDAIREFLMVNSWPPLGSGSNWNFPAWSLSVEMFCYVTLFPLMYREMNRLMGWTISQRFCLIGLLTVTSVLMFIRLWDAQIVTAALYHSPRAISYCIPMIRGLTMFAAGGVVYSFWAEKGLVHTIAGEACDTAALTWLLLLTAAFFRAINEDFLTLLAPPLVFGLAVNRRALVSRLLGAQPFHWLGEISYSLYLLHVPINYALHFNWRWLHRYYWTDLVVTTSIMLAASSLSYYFFESPMRNWIKGAGRPETAFQPLP